MTPEEALAAVQDNSRSASHLQLARHGLDDDFAERLSAALPGNAHVALLDLRGNCFGPKAAQHLAAALEQNTSIKQLLLENNLLEAEGVKHLSSALETNATLLHLSLGNQFLGAQGIRSLADALSANTTLAALHLQGASVGPEGADYLAAALRRNESLTVLDLAGNGLGATGVEHLAGALESNATLRELSLRGNSIGDLGAQHLTTALSRNGGLQKLDLSYNDIRDAGVEILNAGLRAKGSAAPHVELIGNASGKDVGRFQRMSSLPGFGTSSAAPASPPQQGSPASCEAGASSPGFGSLSAAAPAGAAAAAGGPGSPGATASAGASAGGTSSAKAAAATGPTSRSNNSRGSSLPFSALTPDGLDDLLEKIEICLKKIDLAQSSMVRLRKAEVDLLQYLENARDAMRYIQKTNDRALVRATFGGDCTRVARLRAALGSIHLSDMHARDARLTTCDTECALMEERISKEMGLANRLSRATTASKGALLQSRATMLLDSDLSSAFRAQHEDGEDSLEPARDDESGGDEDDSDDGHSSDGGNHTEEPSGGTAIDHVRASISASVAAAVAVAPKARASKAQQGSGKPPIDDVTLRSIFRAVDADGDGHISLQELRFAYASVLLSAGERVDRKRVARWAKKNVKRFDSENKQTLSLAAFREMMVRSDALAKLAEGGGDVQLIKDSATMRSHSKPPKKSRSRSGAKASAKSKGKSSRDTAE